MDETISGQSPVGQRLSKIPKSEIRCVVHQGREIRLSDEMNIGRDKVCDIVIDDPLVSRVHCVIRRIRSRWYVEDAMSTNGTYVNGKKIAAGKAVGLAPGDSLKLGGRIELSLG